MPEKGLRKTAIEESSVQDVTFIGAVLMLHDGYAVHAGGEASHRLAVLHANLIAHCASRFRGDDRRRLLSDVKTIIARQTRDMVRERRSQPKASGDAGP